MSGSVTNGVRLTLPFPDSGLSPNSRLGWRAKAKLTAQYREDAGWAAKALGNGYWGENRTRYTFPLAPPVVADITFVVPDKRRRDADNLLASIKAGFDGMVDAGLIVSDSWLCMKLGSVAIEVRKPPRVVVVLRGSQ